MMKDIDYEDMYFEWIKDETNNDSLTKDAAGVRLALNMLVETDPFEYRTVKSETIGGHLSQTFETDNRGIPIKVLNWISPYYLAGSVI